MTLTQAFLPLIPLRQPAVHPHLQSLQGGTRDPSQRRYGHLPIQKLVDVLDHLWKARTQSMG